MLFQGVAGKHRAIVAVCGSHTRGRSAERTGEPSTQPVRSAAGHTMREHMAVGERSANRKAGCRH